MNLSIIFNRWGEFGPELMPTRRSTKQYTMLTTPPDSTDTLQKGISDHGRLGTQPDF